MDDINGTPRRVLNARFNTPTRYGVLLVCEGAPESPGLWDVWTFLARKLVNPRFYDLLPTWLWYPLVYTVMLPCTVRDHQRMYRSTWVYPPRRRASSVSANSATSEEERADGAKGAAGVVVLAEQLSCALEDCLQQKLEDRVDASVQVEVAFYYRRGSVEAALERLQLRGCYGRDARDTSGSAVLVESERLIVLPLYPQHKAEFTGTAWDAVMGSAYFQRHHNIPHVDFVRSYAESEAYLETWHRHIRRYMGQHGTPDWLFLVFHGTRKDAAANGDTYREEYRSTAEQLRERLSTSWDETADDSLQNNNGAFYRGALLSSRITTAFLGHGNEALKEPRLEKVFLSIIRQLKSISAANSVTSSPLNSVRNRMVDNRNNNNIECSSDDEGEEKTSFAPSEVAALQQRQQQQQPSRTPLPPEMAPTAFVVCPGEALDGTATLYKLQESLFPIVKRLGWKDVQYIPALNDTSEHAEMLSDVLEPYLL